ncbi:hypothetical protein CN378_10650 [Bacillus sp. AFS015802]|uniref:zinc ribbon domain-containing protein n=1 Tax=Bacillus sp. AFS015802 TaxID=2033486 RepID=UPI000BF40173|nr:zinc ribbon domain-containing protein [Bacillus sp. AFS015802]PFA67299.1 hypothetical protein CN378_10650 [Bacillus sp. AFS015802]
MYCKSCGAEQLGTSNYCHVDGTRLQEYTSRFVLRPSSVYCSDCGSSSSTGENYCKGCGNSLLKYSEDSMPAGGMSEEKAAASLTQRRISLSGFQFQYIKHAFLPVLIAFAMLFTISFFLSKDIQGFFNDVTQEALSDSGIIWALEDITAETGDVMPELDKLFSAGDVMLMTHLLNPTVNGSFNGKVFDGDRSTMESSAELFGGFLIVLCIPVLCLIIAGYVMSSIRKKESILEKVFQAAGIAIVYSLVLALLTLFVGFSYKLTSNNELFTGSLNISMDYSFLGALCGGFALAFLFSMLGIFIHSGVRKTAKQFSGEIPFGTSILHGISAPIKGMGAIFIIVLIFVSTKLTQVKEWLEFDFIDLPIGELAEKTVAIVSLLSLQISQVVLNLSHLAPFTFIFKGSEGEGMNGSLSTFGGVNQELESEFELFLAFLDQDTIGMISLVAKLFVLVPAGLCLWVGHRLAKQSGNQYMTIAVFSLVYACILAGINMGVDLGFEAAVEQKYGSQLERSNQSMFMGFSTFDLFIRGFLFSYLFAIAGTFIRKLRR